MCVCVCVCVCVRSEYGNVENDIRKSGSTKLHVASQKFFVFFLVCKYPIGPQVSHRATGISTL